jgi:hypothetical protein
VTYTLTPDSASGTIEPRINGSEYGTVARLTMFVDSGATGALSWVLPASFARDDETADPLPCSFAPGSIVIRETGQRIDPHAESAVAIGHRCKITVDIGVTVTIPPGTPPGTYTAQLIAFISYVGNSKMPHRRPLENAPLLTLHVIDAAIPERPALLQNYPNPFNGPTKIRYGLSQYEQVRLEVVDVLGRVVETLVEGGQYAGWHDVEWNAAGQASGVYFVQLRTPSITQVKKILLAR